MAIWGKEIWVSLQVRIITGGFGYAHYKESQPNPTNDTISGSQQAIKVALWEAIWVSFQVRLIVNENESPTNREANP